MGTQEVDVVKALYQSFRDDDRERTRELMAPDAVWTQMAGFPGGGVHHGPDAVWAGVVEMLRDRWDAWRGEFDEYLDAGDRVIVLGTYVATHNGREARAPFAHVLTVRDGRVASFQQYTDTKVLWDIA